jgi:hypothetical protein
MSSNPLPSDETDNKSNKSVKSNKSKQSDKSDKSDTSNELNKPSKLVTIFVSPGPPQKDGAFPLPRDLAIEASPVFRAALAGENWLEKDDQSMTLRDVDPEVFELLVYYLDNEGLVPPCRTLGTPSEALVKYAKLWMLANLLNMSLLQNIVSKVMQWWIVDMGLDQLEDFMHLVYGRESEYPEGERGILGKMLRFKFYYSEKEDLDNCGYEIIPEMMKALMNTNPAFDEFSPEMVEALLKTGSTFQGYSPEMMKDLMKAGPVFRQYSPEIRNALIEAGEDIGEYALAKNTGRW